MLATTAARSQLGERMLLLLLLGFLLMLSAIDRTYTNVVVMS